MKEETIKPQVLHIVVDEQTKEIRIEEGVKE